MYIPRELVQKAVSAPYASTQSLSSEDQAKKLGLTPRQFDVLSHLLGGHANKVIARQLDLTEATVKAHVTAIMKALNVVKRAQVPMALEKLGYEIKSMVR